MNRTIAYMEEPWSYAPEYEMLGWMHTVGDFDWGTLYNGVQSVCVHLFRKDNWIWGDDPLDTVELMQKKPYVMMFFGSDNSSCFMRLETKEEAREEFLTMPGADWNNSDMIYYNS